MLHQDCVCVLKSDWCSEICHHYQTRQKNPDKSAEVTLAKKIDIQGLLELLFLI